MVLFGNNGKRARLIGSALLILMFVVGGLAGAAVSRLLSADSADTVTAQPRERRSRSGPRRLLEDTTFAREIGLSARQSAEIKTILDRRDVEAKKMWSEFEPRLKEFGQEVHEEISAVLTTEQRTKLDAAIAQRRASKQRRHECKPDTVGHSGKESK
jgi:hypothetical protein